MYVTRRRTTAAVSGSRQFSLRSLMVFVTVCAVYFSQFALAWVHDGDGRAWRFAATIGIAWAVLTWFYLHHRLIGPLCVQCGTPATFALLMFLSGEGWLEIVVTSGIVCFATNLVCFPFAVMLMAMRWSRRTISKEKQEPT
ncbi:MAG: hypothetical protein ABFC96_08935 [Thermoguttaceae bacterium]